MTVAMIEERTKNIQITLEHNCSLNEKDHQDIKKQLGEAKSDTNKRLGDHDDQLTEHEAQINKWRGALVILSIITGIAISIGIYLFQRYIDG